MYNDDNIFHSSTNSSPSGDGDCMTNILLVEDDNEMVMLLKHTFSSNNYQLTDSRTGKDGLEKALTNNYNIIILDIMLPDMDGFEVCRKLREQNIQAPVMMLTSRSEEIDKVVALELGADDYVTKPFGIRELLARTKALLRRAEQSEKNDDEGGGDITIKDF